jgi:hypothetical protein
VFGCPDLGTMGLSPLRTSAEKRQEVGLVGPRPAASRAEPLRTYRWSAKDAMTVTGAALFGINLPGSCTSPGFARHAVTGALGGLVSEDCLDVTVLLISELVTNAVMHADTAVDLQVWADESRVRVEVRDGSSLPPELRHCGLEATSGRGMRLLESLSTRWGVQPTAGGKCVWFELAVDQEPAFDHDDFSFDLESVEAL